MDTIRFELVAVALFVVGLTGCPPPPSGPPSLFNAVDPSLQCPAGQVGWDFSTGGNKDAIARNSVAGSIAITRADFGGSCQAGLAADFRAACDGIAFCSVATPGCADSDVTLEYQCGTETHIYSAHIENPDGTNQISLSCSSAITVVNAIYAPDADEPADITNALAQICTGKRRCANGTSGFALNASQDPQPNVSKTVRVTYVCDAQARERTVEVDDFTLDFYCPEGAGSSVANLDFISIQAVVPRSYDTDPAGQSAYSQANLKSKYTAWAEEHFEGLTAACERKRECRYKMRQLPDHYERNDLSRNIAPDEDAVDVMGIPLGPKELFLNYQEYFVGYTCGADPEIIWKYLPRPSNSSEPVIKLRCGEVVNIHDVYVNESWAYSAAERQATLELFQENCDGKQVCYSPYPKGQAREYYYDDNNNRQQREFQSWRNSTITMEYSCGEIDFARRYQKSINYRAGGLGGDELAIECDAPRDDRLARGIRIDSVTPTSKTLAMTKLCFGRDRCVLPGGQGDVTIGYRCGEGATLQTISYSGIGNTGNRIECRPTARFIDRYVYDPNGNKKIIDPDYCLRSAYEDANLGPDIYFSPDYVGGRCNTFYSYSLPSCPYMVDYGPDEDGDVPAGQFDLCQIDEFHWDFRCGPSDNDIQTMTNIRTDPYVQYNPQNPTAETSRTNGWNTTDYPAFPRTIENVSCLPPLEPYVSKKCVQQNCYGQVSRGDEMQCQVDSSKIPRFSYAKPIVKNYQSTASGEPAYWGGTEALENGVTTLKSGFPYQLFPFITYQTPGGYYWPLPQTTDVTTWAYDVFQPVDDNDAPAGAEVYGFRCLINSTDMTPKFIDYPGYWRLFSGGSPTTIPEKCFGHIKERSNDASDAWYDAAKRAGMAESQFELKYERVGTKMVVSIDPGAANSVRWFSPHIYWSPNPIGFAYDPTRDYIDAIGFYGQTADFANQRDVVFAEATEIELAALRQSVTANRFHLDVNDAEYSPTIQVDFSYYLRGDNKKNPYSPRTKVAAGDALSLARDNLRAVVEIAYADDTNTNWTAAYAERFTKATPLSNHNVYFATHTINLKVSDLMKARMLTVRGTNAAIGEKTNGWMATFDDEDTAFKVRTCLVSDDFSMAFGGNDAAPTPLTNNSYSLNMTKRCTEPSTLVLGRELYVTPEPVADKALAETEGASMGGNGDAETGSSADNGTETNCTQICTGGTGSACGVNGAGTCGADGRCQEPLGNQQCVSNNRSGSGSAVGSVKLTLYSNRSDNRTQSANDTTTSTTSNTTEMMTFQIMDVTDTSSGDASHSYDFKIDIGLNLGPIIDAAKGLEYTPKPPGWTIELNGEKPKNKKTDIYGVQFIIEAQYNFAIGPFPMAIIFAFTVQLIPHLTLHLAGGTFTGPNPDNPALSYPCFASVAGNNKCYAGETTARSFPAAKNGCREKGGRLATAYTATEAAAIEAAASQGQNWVGAVPQYLYQYAPCADVGTPQATPIPTGHSCAASSRTRYTWLTRSPASSSTAFATQAGNTSTTFSGLALPTGMSMSAAPSYVHQGLAGIHYTKTTGKLGHAPRTQSKSSVCEYDPATAVAGNLTDISIALEVMAALSIEACTPSGDFGICLQGILKFFTAEIRFGIALTRSDIYGANPATGTGNIPLSTLSGTEVYGRWSWSAIALEFNAVLRFLFWDTTINIKSIKPVASDEGYLFRIPNNSFKNHLESP